MVHHVVTPVDAGVRVSEKGGSFLRELKLKLPMNARVYV